METKLRPVHLQGTHYTVNHNFDDKYGSIHYAIIQHSVEKRGTLYASVRHYVPSVDAVADEELRLSLS